VLEPLARLGYASKAFIYCLIGVLAAMAATEQGGNVTDTRGALRVVLSQPFGNTVLFVLAVGLCGYAAWRILDALFDSERRGTDAKGLVIRISAALRGAIYGGVGIEAFRLARGLRASGGSDARVRAWTARIMSLPFGEWLVAIAGLIVAGYGIGQIVAAVKNKPEESMDLSRLPPRRRELLTRICRFGVAARAAIIVTIGAFLVRAALQHDPREAHGLRESVLELAGMIEGRWLLGAIAVGLFAYGVDQAVHAAYKRIRSPV
jgi:Domain of Unknown Function (DUF1206)